jgi:hypothetical protein
MSEKSTYEEDFRECFELYSEGEITKEKALQRLENRREDWHFKWRITEEQIHEYEKLKEKYPNHEKLFINGDEYGDFNPELSLEETMAFCLEEHEVKKVGDEYIFTGKGYIPEFFKIFNIQDNGEGYKNNEEYKAKKLYADTRLKIEKFQNSNSQTSPQFSPAENLVMAYFPQFKNDYPILIDKGYMTKNGDYLRWGKSQKLLAEYFHNLKSNDSKRHWQDIENLFSEMNLAQAFQNSKSINQSKNYQELLKDLKV